MTRLQNLIDPPLSLECLMRGLTGFSLTGIWGSFTIDSKAGTISDFQGVSQIKMKILPQNN